MLAAPDKRAGGSLLVPARDEDESLEMEQKTACTLSSSFPKMMVTPIWDQHLLRDNLYEEVLPQCWYPRQIQVGHVVI